MNSGNTEDTHQAEHAEDANDQIEADTQAPTKEEQDFAICAALNNIENCIRLRKRYDDVSITNFFRNNKAETSVLQNIFGPYTDKTNWLTDLHNYVDESTNRELQTIGLRAFEALLTIRNTETITHQDQNTTPKSTNPTTQQTDTIRSHTVEQGTLQPQQRNIFGRLFSMIPKSPNAFTKSIKDMINTERTTTHNHSEKPHVEQPGTSRQDTTTNQENRPNTSVRMTNPEHGRLKQTHVSFEPQKRTHTPQQDTQQYEANHVDLNTHIPQRIINPQQQATYQQRQTTQHIPYVPRQETFIPQQVPNDQEPDLINIRFLNTLEEMGKCFRQMSTAVNEQKPIQMDILKNSRQNVVEWFERFDRQTILWDTVHKGPEVTKHLEASALYFWDQMHSDDKYDYKCIRDHLIDKLGPTDRTFSVKADFYICKQELDETIDQFAHRLNSFRKRWPPSDLESFDRDLMSAFKKGCLPSIGIAIINSQARTFDVLQKEATRIAERLQHMQDDVAIEAVIRRDNNCFFCKQPGHFAKDCPEKIIEKTEANRYQKTSGPTCMYCGKLGHFAIDCFEMKKIIEQKSVTFHGTQPKGTTDATNYHNKKKYCSHCKMENHDTEFCNILKRLNRNSGTTKKTNIPDANAAGTTQQNPLNQ